MNSRRRITINTKVKTSIAHAIEKSGLEARYDNKVRDILAQKVVLAHILVATMEEFKGLEPGEVIPLIEGEPLVRYDKESDGNVDININQNDINPMITGLSTVLSEPGAGIIEEDIRFYVRMPYTDEVSEKGLKIISNIEMQNNINPGYDIAKRQVFYSCRMISEQKDREFIKSDYDSLKKVSSIWIFPSPRVSNKLTITRFKMAQFNDYGECEDISNRYDMLGIININLSPDAKECIESDSDVIGLLGVLFSETMPVEERKEILEKEYGIPMEEETERRFDDMCNLSLDIKYRAWEAGMEKGREEGIEQGMEKGIEQGREEERTSLICLMILRGFSEETIIDLGFTKDDIERAKKMDEEQTLL